MHVELRGRLTVDSLLQLWVPGAELKLSDYTLSYLVDLTFAIFSSGE